MTARSTSLIRLSPSSTLGISQLRPPLLFDNSASATTRAVSQPGWLRSASFAMAVSSGWLLGVVDIKAAVTRECGKGVTHAQGHWNHQASWVPDIFQFAGACLGHAAHAF